GGGIAAREPGSASLDEQVDGRLPCRRTEETRGKAGQIERRLRSDPSPHGRRSAAKRQRGLAVWTAWVGDDAAVGGPPQEVACLDQFHEVTPVAPGGCRRRSSESRCRRRRPIRAA